ncbi:reverse transcriptase domain-containing protein [Enterobacter asburiae]|nr:reverse transcriptase domain-containing protein [Enterobacter asburiae]
MTEALRQNRYTWVCRTDIRGYYRNINKDRLMEQVCEHVHSPVLTGLIRQYVHYSVEDGGEFHTPTSGIARGCALSPLMGAMHLYAMDAWFAGQMRTAQGEKNIACFYARFMDDIVILAHTRWQLRKHVRALNAFFNQGGFCQHPDKTFIGRTERGFDWMGAQMYDSGVEHIAPRARLNHAVRLRQLYERVRKWPAERRQARMSQYRIRWELWAISLVCAVCMSSHAHAGERTDQTRACLEAAIASGSIAPKTGGGWQGSMTCSHTVNWGDPPPVGIPYSAFGQNLTSGYLTVSIAGASGWSLGRVNALGPTTVSYTCTGTRRGILTIPAGNVTSGPVTWSYPDGGPPASCNSNLRASPSITRIADYQSAAATMTVDTPTYEVTYNLNTGGSTIGLPGVFVYAGVASTGIGTLSCTAGNSSFGCTWFGVGIGGTSADDPGTATPVNPVPLPNCSISADTAIDLGNVPARSGLTGNNPVVILTGTSRQIRLDCSSGSAGSKAAVSTISLWSADVENTSGGGGTIMKDPGYTGGVRGTDPVGLVLRVESSLGLENPSCVGSGSICGVINPPGADMPLGLDISSAIPVAVANVPALQAAREYHGVLSFNPVLAQESGTVAPGLRTYHVNIEMLLQ